MRKKRVTVKGGGKESLRNLRLQTRYYGRKPLIYNGGDDSREDPPVPLPNTEVKLSYADGTASRGRVGSCRLSNKKDTPTGVLLLYNDSCLRNQLTDKAALK